ncbi:MAG: hypothetical protein M1826_001707 [Phylliscum demangeonii]|nr:MAG: hypothetical protein M1826_001707 [Phylliscum demangeonii]
MPVTGQRFTVDLSSDEDGEAPPPRASRAPASSGPLLRDVTEKAASAAPTFPQATDNSGAATGFPAHRKRFPPSSFKNQRQKGPPSTRPAGGWSEGRAENEDGGGRNATTNDWHEAERRRIDDENRTRIAAMSDEEIQQQRQELLQTLSPALVEQLRGGGGRERRRAAEMDQAHAAPVLPKPSLLDHLEAPDDHRHLSDSDHTRAAPALTKSSPSDDDQDPDGQEDTTGPPSAPADEPSSTRPSQTPRFHPDSAPLVPPPGLHPVTAYPIPATPSVHFPRPTTSTRAPDLDPSAPDFLTQLHDKYFPELPMDLSKLAWMAPLPDSSHETETATEPDPSAYSPHQASLAPSAIRFDFRGALLPPRTARQIPTTAGLHHHGDAPEAAGYTIPELGYLARSAFPAQRCIAFQTLGRILYRLGTGGFGPDGGALADGLWACVAEARVLDTLTEEAARLRAHRTAQTLAIEALWHWQRGGGKRPAG